MFLMISREKLMTWRLVHVSSLTLRLSFDIIAELITKTLNQTRSLIDSLILDDFFCLLKNQELEGFMSFHVNSCDESALA